MVHPAYRNNRGMLDGGDGNGAKRGQTRALERGIMNNTYLGFWNAHFLHRSTDGLAANDDAIRKTHHGEFTLVDVLDVSDEGMSCESRDEPAEQYASKQINVNDVWLKVADVPVKSKDSPHELHRSMCLVEWEMFDAKAT
jgi:hypothetical protein